MGRVLFQAINTTIMKSQKGLNVEFKWHRSYNILHTRKG